MAAKEIVTAALARENVIVFSKEFCPFCTRVKDLLTSRGVAYKAIELDSDEPIVYAGASASGSAVQDIIKRDYKHGTVPAVFIGGTLLGGCDSTMAADRSGQLAELLARL